MFRFLIALGLAFAVPAHLAAQDVSEEQLEAARLAEETGRLMAEVQAATAVAQLQYTGMTEGALWAGYLGAIAMPGSQGGVWDTVIVARRGEGPDAMLVALAEYQVAEGAILSETIHLGSEAPVLDGPASAMAQARIFAPRAVLAAGHTTFCADEGATSPAVTFTTIVLPPREDGSFSAYVLNGPIEAGAIPLGKHFRVSFDQFGISGEPELVTDTCEVVTWDQSADLAMQVYVTEFPGADAPSEIHGFLSSLLPMSLGVVTGDLIWPMAGGGFAEPVPAAEAGYVHGE